MSESGKQWLPAHDLGGGQEDDYAAASLASLLLRQPDWYSRAACRGHDLEAFVPDRHQPVKEARAICSGCPVREECLRFAMDAPAWLCGVWGGTTPRDRHSMRRQRTATTSAHSRTVQSMGAAGTTEAGQEPQ